MNHRIWNLLLVLGLVAGSGASCPRNRQIVNDYAPIVLNPNATLADVIRVVNSNGSRIQQLQSSDATLAVHGMPGLPRLDASYAFERPRRFRLRAETRLTGTELDLGSNDEIYWMWVRMSQEPGVYWGRHALQGRSAASNLLPVSPQWLIEALGVVELDPTAHHEGPFRTRPGQLEIRTTIATPQGTQVKVTVIDDARGWVLEQQLYDAQNTLLASSLASGFQFDPLTGVSLPRVVEVRVPAASLHFTLETPRHFVNQLSGDPTQLWTRPEISGVPPIDLDGAPPLAQQSSPAQRMMRPAFIAGQEPRARESELQRLPSPSPFERLRRR